MNDETFTALIDAWIDRGFDRLANAGVPDRNATPFLAAAFDDARRAIEENESTTFPSSFMHSLALHAGPPRAVAGTLLDPATEQSAGQQLLAATDPARAADNGDITALLWTSALVLGPETRDVLDLHWRQHLEAADIAAALEMLPAEITEMIDKLPQQFGNVVRARLLWAGGLPTHNVLADELAGAGIRDFDTNAVRLAFAHARVCDSCRAAANPTVSPIEVFAAIPITLAPPGVRSSVIETATFHDPAEIEPEPGTEGVTDLSGTGTEGVIAPAAAASAAAAAAANAAPPPRSGPGPARQSGPPPAGIGPVHAPASRAEAREEAKRKRMLLIGAIAAAVVLIGGVVFILTRSDDKEAVEVTSDNNLSPSTVEKQTYLTTTTIATTTTRRETTTTTTPLPEFTASLTVNGSETETSIPQGYPVGAVTLTWQATSNAVSSDDSGTNTITVTVTGAGVLSKDQPASGSLALCPSAETDTCNVVPGDYAYTVEVFEKGESKDSKTFSFTITPPA